MIGKDNTHLFHTAQTGKMLPIQKNVNFLFKKNLIFRIGRFWKLRQGQREKKIKEEKKYQNSAYLMGLFKEHQI